MLSFSEPTKSSFSWAEVPAGIVSENLTVATWVSVLMETSGLDVIIEPREMTEALLMSISFEFSEIEVVSSVTCRLDGVSYPTTT